MNVERLHTILFELRNDFADTSYVPAARELVAALTRVIQNGPQAQYIEQLGDARQTFNEAAARSAVNTWPAAWLQVLTDLGIDDLTGIALATVANSIFRENEITPTLALEAISPQVDRLTQLEADLTQLLDIFGRLNVEMDLADPGTAELAVTIPRGAVHENLPDLGQEFRKLDQIVGPFQELVTGGREPLHVTSIASSDFMVYVALGGVVARQFLESINLVLDTYERIRGMIDRRRQMEEDGLPDDILATIDAHIQGAMRAAIEEHVDQILAARSADASAPVLPDGREHELRADLVSSLNGLANRVDRGYVLDITATPADEETVDEESTGPTPEGQALAEVIDLAPRRRQVSTAGRPILSLPEAPPPPNDDA